MQARKEEFRQYLEDTGVIGALTKALIKLYEMKYDRPESAVAFIQKNMADDFPSMDQYQKLLDELNENKAKLAEIVKRTAAVTSEKPDESKKDSADSSGATDATVDKNANTTSSDPKDARKQLEALHADVKCTSLLKQHLPMDLFDQLITLKTKSDKTLLNCINSGLRHPKSSVGVYAADADAYEVFKDLFDPIIQTYHNPQAVQPTSCWDGDVDHFQDLGPSIISTRIRCARSLQDYPLNPAMTEEDYVKSMDKVKEVLEKFTDELAGQFYQLEGMDKAVQEKMIADHQLFKADDENLKDAGALEFWPKGRGIFKSQDEKFLVWVNEEDHLRFISMDQGGNIKEVYNRLKKAIDECGKELTFKIDPKLGFITFCPTNLGSTIRASVKIKLPELTKAGTLETLVEAQKLQIRGEHGNKK